MSPKVVSLKGKTAPAVRRKECAEILSEVLAKARSGEVDALMVVAVRPDGSCTVNWVTGDKYLVLLGAMTASQFDMMHDASDES